MQPNDPASQPGPAAAGDPGLDRSADGTGQRKQEDRAARRLGFRGDASELYTIHPHAAAAFAAEVLTSGTEPVMIVALDGYVDAGSAVEIAVKTLRSALDAETLVTFDADGLIDYRSRRPGLTFSGNAFTAYDTPHLTVDQVRDATGKPFLLFTGPEPDLSWEKFCVAVQQVIEALGVRLTISLMAIPMGVPHTRPTGMSVHATAPELIPDAQNWIGSVEVPGNIASLLELRLGQAGHPAMGFAAHVPHYLARSDYPVATRTLLAATADAGDLVLPTDSLDESIAQAQAELSTQLSEHHEIGEVVHALEKQYDAFMALHGNSLLDSEALPTADELAAQFEAYLANQDGTDN